MVRSHLQKPGPEVPGHRWTHYPRAGEDAWVLVPDSTRTTWCSESGILVRDYDHFCPWTGTTIAGGNMCVSSISVSSCLIFCAVSLATRVSPQRCSAVASFRTAQVLLTPLLWCRCCFHLFIYSLCAACIFVVFVGITAAGVAAEEAAQRQSTGG